MLTWMTQKKGVSNLEKLKISNNELFNCNFVFAELIVIHFTILLYCDCIDHEIIQKIQTFVINFNLNYDIDYPNFET